MQVTVINPSTLSTQGGVGGRIFTASNPAPAAAGPAAGVGADVIQITGSAEAAAGATAVPVPVSGNGIAPKGGSKTISTEV